MNLDHKIFGGIITGIMIIVIVWSASILSEQYSDQDKFNFLTDEQIEFIQELKSSCNNYNVNSKLSCMSRIDAEIKQFQIEGASSEAIRLDDVVVCHSISSDIDCLLSVAQKSNNKNACFAIVNSHEEFEPSEEDNLKYLTSLQNYCLSRHTSS